MSRSSGEGLNTGRHEKVGVRCLCSRLAVLHGAPRTRCCRSLWPQWLSNHTYAIVRHTSNDLHRPPCCHIACCSHASCHWSTFFTFCPAEITRVDVTLVTTEWRHHAGPELDRRTFCAQAGCTVVMIRQLPLRPWSTMECSQPVAFTTKRTLLVASRVKTLPRWLTNSGSTMPRAAHQEGVIWCHQCITSHSGSAPASPNMRPTSLALSRMHAIHHLRPCPHPFPPWQTTHVHKLWLTRPPSTYSSSASEVILRHLW